MESKNIRLGLFTVIGTIFLAAAMYLIGARQALFKPTITLIANFRDVNGLQPGNNVRYSGINVGTVRSITISTDSTVEVKMIVDKSVQAFIRDSYLVSLGTDGLMGNKLINIQPSSVKGRKVTNQDTLQTLPAIDTYAMLRTLDLTNENVNLISQNLRNITEQLSEAKGPAWKLLNDTAMSSMLTRSMKSLQRTTENANEITDEIQSLVKEFKSNSGVLSLLKDTSTRESISGLLSSLNRISNKADLLTDSVQNLVSSMQRGKGSFAALISDTLISADLKSSITNLKEGTDGFQQNMEALKSSFLLRGFFRKRDK
jgi:phospholipid/cholesterol/gamma-HCH transport system substrate-binding protein